jgi:excisionase family DNA binding protein
VISTLTLPLSTIGPRDSCRGITHTSAAETRTAWGDPVAPASIVRIGCIPLSTQDSLLTTNQTAHILSLSRSTICRLLKTGELPSITIGRTRRISRLDIDRYIEQQRKLHREKAVGF